MKNVLKLNKRDWIGLACWMLVSILVGLLAFPIMVAREYYQYIGRSACFACHGR